jgi:hypothetical protein
MPHNICPSPTVRIKTIGDCYVAATGLPVQQPKHAVIMARFARDCLAKMSSVVRRLEVSLGPDTAELSMRVGLHSGPVTAGVLRGEKSRFQLFGDTVNTAARMESTGLKDKIHLSAATADLINASGDCKDVWVVPRDDLVDVKGKGKMKTHWLAYGKYGITGSVVSSVPALGSPPLSNSQMQDDDSLGLVLEMPENIQESESEGLSRLIDWNVDVLKKLLQQIVAMRAGNSSGDHINNVVKKLRVDRSPGMTVLDEVKEIIHLPSNPAKYEVDPETIMICPCVLSQLRDFVANISGLYRDNTFHSFEHASHVTQSATKLLARVVTPDAIDNQNLTYKKQAETTLHEYTYGITSDPLLQFAVTFSALIHDVDHQGVPNAQLVKEKTDDALLYNFKSVAEQNSVDVAWELLMEPCYADLRASIYSTQDEHDRFRQLVINTVMATDIVDKELGALRRRRWEAAFAVDNNNSSPPLEATDRKATIVIEHLIQASDVAHTMQHWHIYLVS